jgi:hypothetical protein
LLTAAANASPFGRVGTSAAGLDRAGFSVPMQTRITVEIKPSDLQPNQPDLNVTF